MGVLLNAPRTYRDALDFLFARTTGQWRLGLERIEAFLGALGDPQRRLRTLHVAGTNGKGSVCATLETVLRARGLKVTRLARGVPVGAELEYTDVNTIAQAMLDRRAA